MHRPILLLKAHGQFKHSGKYYLLNGRWHALHQDKPAPKGAPVATHKHAAGQFSPAKHFTDAEWEQLKLPPENVNAGTFNKQLKQLQQLSEAGDVTGILGSQFGSNTYGKKLATIANKLLEMHGSTHKVAAGQKAGTHIAVSQAPADDAPTDSAHADGDKWVMPLKDAVAEHKELISAAETPSKADDKDVLAEQKAELEKMEAASTSQDWKPTIDQVMALHGKPAEEIKATMKKWAAKLGGHDKLAALLQEYQQKAVTQAKPKASAPAAPAAPKEPKPQQPAPTFNAGDIVPGDQLKHLKPGSVVQLFSDGKPWRKAMIGHGSVWFSKIKGEGWQKNALKPQHYGWLKTGGYGDAQLISNGADGWMSDAQKAMAEQLLKTAQNGKHHQDAKAYRMGAAVVVGVIGKPFSFTWADEDGKWGAGFSSLQEKKLASGEGLMPIDLGGKSPSEAGPKEGDTKQAADGGTLVLKDGRWHKQGGKAADEQQTGTSDGAGADLGAKYQQPDGTYKINTYRGISVSKTPNDHGAIGKGPYSTPYKHIAEAYAGKGGNVEEQTVELKNPLIISYGDLTELQKQHVGGMVTGFDAEMSEKWNQWMHDQGYDGAMVFDLEISSTIPQEVVKLAPLKGSSETSATLSMPAFEEGKTKTGVVAYYEKVAQKILDMAAAGDAAGLEQMKADGLKPNSKGKITNTWAGKTANSKKLLALHTDALMQATDKVQGTTSADQAAPAVSPEPVPAPAASAAAEPPKVDYLSKIENAAGATSAQMFAKLHLDQHGDSAEAQSQVQAALQKFADKKAELAQRPAPAAAPPASAVDGKAKLDQIPWDSQLLPDSNKNAKSHNKQVEKIKAMAYAGDVAGLEAFKAGVNTYGKKQNLLAQTALAALKEDAHAAGPAAANGAPDPLHLPAFSDKAAYYAWADKHGAAFMEAGAKKYGSDESFKQSAEYSALLDAQNSVLGQKPEQGPQEGETKPGADGMLVFSKGRWHKQEQPQAAEPEAQAQADQHPVDAVLMPELNFTNASNNSKVKAALEKLKEQIKEQGPEVLKGATKHMKAKGKYIVTLPGQFGSLKVYGYEQAPDHVGTKVYQYVEALKAAAGKPKKAAPKSKVEAAPAAAPAQPAAAPGALPSMDNWVQTGGQGGSNPGGRFKDPSGQEWYCKFPADEDVAKSEVLAAQLYAAAGLAAQDAMLVTKDGKVGIASKWVSVSKAAPAALAKAEGAQAGFAVDAWLANWDVVGMAYDNLQIGQDGKAYRIDAGGSLAYRAQGGKKAFGATVGEIDSMRDAKINAQSAAVFGSMTEADITASVAKVAAISDQTIRVIVEAHGPGDAAAKKQMANTLIARRADLLAKYPKAAKAKPAKPQFKIENLSLPPNFEDWNGSGKGLSSHHFINESNQAAVNAVYGAAKQGDLDTIKQVQAPVFDKASGQVKAHVPLEQHPSQHVKAYWSDMVNEVDLQLNPPRLPEIGEIVAGQDLPEIAALLKPVPSGGAVALVPKHQKVGDYILLGKAINVAPVVPKANDAAIGSDAWRKKASEHYHAASAESKSAFSLYVTTSGARALNTALRTGNLKTVVADKSVAKHVENFKGLLVDIPEGSTFVRRMGMKGYGQKPNEKAIKELQQFLMMAEPGTVMQEPGFTSTSWTGGNKILGNNDIEWEFVAGKGVKMFPAWLTANKGEGEGLLPPNQRYMIVSSKKDGKTVRVKAILLPTID